MTPPTTQNQPRKPTTNNTSEAARWIPRSIEQASEAHVATTRIQPLLLMPEAGFQRALGPPTSGGSSIITNSTMGNGGDSGAVLTIEDCDFSWECGGGEGEGPGQPQLRGVSLSVRPGELIVVAGPVGAGKSTLIEAVLGEVSCVRGGGGGGGVGGGGVRVRPGSRVAYCAQQPWIQAGTVRENVLFARAEGLRDPDRYDRAVAACALTHDLERLEHGDLTQIGELGVNLSGAFLLLSPTFSGVHVTEIDRAWGALITLFIPLPDTHHQPKGGQRARVALARAVYADADLYLLDDVLSAVDAEVSKHLFHQVCGLWGGVRSTYTTRTGGRVPNEFNYGGGLPSRDD